MQSGHELFKRLDARAEASYAHGGLINAQDSLQDVQDFKLPEVEGGIGSYCPKKAMRR